MNRVEFANALHDIYGKWIKFTDIEFKKFCKLKQDDKVWWHLRQFGSITNKICHDVYGIRHCPKAIQNLRENPFIYGEGHYYIESVPIKAPDRWGNTTNPTLYILKQYT